MARGDPRLRRILHLQQRLEQVEIGRLARTNMRLCELKTHEQQLFAYLEPGGAIAGIFPGLVLNRLQQTKHRQAALASQTAAQERAINERARRVKQTERLVERAERERHRTESARELQDILDGVVGRPQVSAP